MYSISNCMRGRQCTSHYNYHFNSTSHRKFTGMSSGTISVRSGSFVPRKAYGRFEFIVCDWSLTKSSPGANVVSQEFIMSDASTWILRIFPGGTSCRQAGFISVQMALVGLGTNAESVTATFNISVLGRKDKRQAHNPDVDRTYSLKSPSAMEFKLGSDSQSSWAVDNFMLAQELETVFLDNDAVLFALDIEILGKPEVLSTRMPAYLGQDATLNDDLRALFLNQDDSTTFSDITLVVGTKKIRCHRSILAARSEAFKKKFQSSSFTTKLLFNGGHHHLDNVSPLVFEEMIKFIYTDACSHHALAIHDRELLAAAVCFQLPRLVQLTEDHIGETLTPNNVIETLNLAADLKSERLDFCCSEFIAAHQSDVLATNTLCRLHPDALRDLISKSILPASSLLLASGAPNTKSTATSLAAADGTSAVTAAIEAGMNDVSEEVKNDGVDCLKEMMSKDFIPAARGIANTEILSP